WLTPSGDDKNSEGYPSGQRGQTVNLLAYAFGGSNPPPSTSFKRYKCFVEVDANHRIRMAVRPIRRERIGTRREGGAAPEGRVSWTRRVIHLPPPASKGTNVSWRWMRTTGSEWRFDRFAGSESERDAKATRPRRARAKDGRVARRASLMDETSNPPPSTTMQRSQKLRQRTPPMRE